MLSEISTHRKDQTLNSNEGELKLKMYCSAYISGTYKGEEATIATCKMPSVFDDEKDFAVVEAEASLLLPFIAASSSEYDPCLTRLTDMSPRDLGEAKTYGENETHFFESTEPGSEKIVHQYYAVPLGHLGLPESIDDDNLNKTKLYLGHKAIYQSRQALVNTYPGYGMNGGCDSKVYYGDNSTFYSFCSMVPSLREKYEEEAFRCSASRIFGKAGEDFAQIRMNYFFSENETSLIDETERIFTPNLQQEVGIMSQNETGKSFSECYDKCGLSLFHNGFCTSAPSEIKQKSLELKDTTFIEILDTSNNKTIICTQYCLEQPRLVEQSGSEATRMVPGVTSLIAGVSSSIFIAMLPDMMEVTQRAVDSISFSPKEAFKSGSKLVKDLVSKGVDFVSSAYLEQVEEAI